MDINQLLKGFDCSCGKHHSCPIQYVYIENGAISHLREICADYAKILVVSDENTFAAAGMQTMAALDGKTVDRVTFTGKKILVPNEDAIATVTQALDGHELNVGIGSGVMQDLCKYVSHESVVPYMVVATAPSMDGYASDGAAMITGGMKVTYKAGLPIAIVSDTAVLKEAPMEMIKAGYGDIIGKFSALNDWQLSHCVNDEYFCGRIYDMTMEQVQHTLDLADGIAKRDEQSIGALMEALVVIGILMSFAGSSRPASGSEHHLSHFFEITGIVEGKEYFPHGIDVAYSTIITARLREKLLAEDFPVKGIAHDAAAYKQEMERVYGPVAEGNMKLQEKTGRYAQDRMGIYLEREYAIRTILERCPKGAQIEAMLAKVGLDIKEFYELYGQAHIDDAVTYAKDIKDRYTVLWMIYDFFGGCKNV
jgi:glycerol-1-phosphate dehydrogenase [NAD(P)+]